MKTQQRTAETSPRMWQQHLANSIAVLLVPLLTFFLTETMIQGAFRVPARIVGYNYIFYAATLLLAVGIFRSLRRATRVFLVTVWLLGTINYVVLTFRSMPIMPADFRSIGTAMNVAGGYSFPFSLHYALGALGLAALWFLAGRLSWVTNRRSLRIAPAVLGLAAWIGFGIAVMHPWAPYEMGFDATIHRPDYMQKENGTVLSFVHALRYQEVPEPEDYSLERVISLAERYRDADVTRSPHRTLSLAMLGTPVGPTHTAGPAPADDDPITALNRPARVVRAPGVRPDIVVVMNESFADLRQLTDLTVSGPVTPVLDRLTTDAQHGTAHVSIIGGSTATSEFEFLTGASMAFLPQGVIAYQQYLQTETPSLVSLLKEQGYDAHALHPFGASGWERDRVYPLLDFDTRTFLEDWPEEADRIRDFVSDADVYTRITERLDTADTPQFIFAVTMQNHGPYGDDFPNFPEPLTVTRPETTRELDQYVNLLHASDRALGDFLLTLKHRPRPTLVLFFGDHQPNNQTLAPLIDTLEDGSVDDGDAVDILRRQTPYLLWANYDIPEATDGHTSLNYLANQLLDQTELRRSPWFAFLRDVREVYPILNSGYAVTPDGTHLRVLEHTEDPALSDYEVLQYNYLFDTQNRVAPLFSVPADD